MNLTPSKKPNPQESLQKLNDQLLMARSENNKKLIMIITKVIDRIKNQDPKKSH
jgi:hypothetical protein